jgi:hypothetical protein
MAYMSELDIELNNLREDVKELKIRVGVETRVGDYWYLRCMRAEGVLNDVFNNYGEGGEGQRYPTTD